MRFNRNAHRIDINLEFFHDTAEGVWRAKAGEVEVVVQDVPPFSVTAIDGDLVGERYMGSTTFQEAMACAARLLVLRLR